MTLKYCLLFVVTLFNVAVSGQAIKPNLQDAAKWKITGRNVQFINEDGKKGVAFDEVEGAGFMVLKGLDFSNGTIELDMKGNDKFQQSFVGIAFHVQDTGTYDAVYLRPFNFRADDSLRRSHAVQYISIPGGDWEPLREKFPGKYENKIVDAPAAEDWVHVKIVVKGSLVTTFINDKKQPSLTVSKLNNYHKGKLALWVGNFSAGSFANLVIVSTGKK